MKFLSISLIFPFFFLFLFFSVHVLCLGAFILKKQVKRVEIAFLENNKKIKNKVNALTSYSLLWRTFFAPSC